MQGMSNTAGAPFPPPAGYVHFAACNATSFRPPPIRYMTQAPQARFLPIGLGPFQPNTT